MEEKFIKLVKEKGELGVEESFKECDKKNATYKIIRYIEESKALGMTMGQELPSKLVKL